MIDGEWRLVYPGTDYTFGTGASPTFNRTTPDIGDANLRVADTARPRQDGQAFGIDFRGGQTIGFDLGVRSHSESAVRNEVGALRAAWRADAVRLVPGGVAELHAQYAGRRSVVYGRPRRFAPNLAEAATNFYATVQADFAGVDDVFYGANDETIAFGIVPPVTGGGLLAPLAAPLSTTLTSDRSQGFTVVSELPVWPVITFYGPVVNPVLTVPGALSIEARVTLVSGESLVIDSRPWVRSAMRQGTISVAGTLRGTRLSRAALPPGKYEVGLKGTDPTGTASVHFAWRPAFSSL